MSDSFESSDASSDKSGPQILSSADWLRRRFPILHAEEFSNTFIARYRSENPDVVAPQDHDAFVLRVQPDDPVYQSLLTEVQRELEAVQFMSLQSGYGEPNAAKSALVYLIANAGEPVVGDARDLAVSMALQAVTMWTERAELRSDALAHLSWLLGFGGDLPLNMRIELLDAFEACLRSGDYSVAEVSACMQNAVQLETRLFDKSDVRKAHLLRWIKLCAKYGSSSLCVLLDAVSDVSDDIEIKQAAKAAAYELRGSVRRLWDDTVVDQVSALNSRAERLLEGRKKKYPEADMAQHVISQCKGEVITDAGDPRLSQLLEVMRDGTERVRLAAARCLTECNISAEQPFPEIRESLYCVAEILVNAGDSRYVGDAIWILNNFKATNPHLAAYADAAISSATSKFLK